MTEQPQNPEDQAAEQPPGDADAATAPTEVNAPGPGDVPADTEVNPVEPEAAPTMVSPPPPPPPSPSPSPEADAGPAPTGVEAPSPVAENAPSPLPDDAPSPAAVAPPPPPPPPPAPPRVALESGPHTSGGQRPEIPVIAAFAGGFVLAMILRRLAR